MIDREPGDRALPAPPPAVVAFSDGGRESSVRPTTTQNYSDGQEHDAADDDSETDAQSFRERVEELRGEGAEERDEEGERPENPFVGGGPGTGGMGGNPMARMMGGVMGGGGPGGAPGGGPGGRSEESTEEQCREAREVRDEPDDIRRELERIGDAIDDE